MSPEMVRRLQIPAAAVAVAVLAFWVALVAMSPSAPAMTPAMTPAPAGHIAEQHTELVTSAPLGTVASATTVNVRPAERTVVVAVPPQKQETARVAAEPEPVTTTTTEPTVAPPSFTPTYPTPMSTESVPITPAPSIPFCASPNPTHPACHAKP